MKNMSLHAVGKLLIEKHINFEALKRTMTNVWNLQDGMISCSMDVKIFVLQFFYWQDKEKGMYGRPYCLKQRLLFPQELSNFKQTSKVNLNFSLFWVRLYSLPFGFPLNERIKAISLSVGEVM